MLFKTSLFCLAVVSLIAIAETPAQACSCAQPQGPADALAAADAVFEGTVLSQSTGASGIWNHTILFRVMHAWKGPAAGQSIAVATPGTDSASCGIEAAIGDVLLVYASRLDGTLTTSACTRTRPISGAADDLAALGPPLGFGGGGGLPGAGCDDQSGCTLSGERPTVGDGSSLPWLGSAAAIIVVAIARRRRSRR